MLFACELSGGALDTTIMVGCACAWCWGWYMLARVLGWARPKRVRLWLRDLWLSIWYKPKPPCQSCNSFIGCAMNKVTRCPRLQPRFWKG